MHYMSQKIFLATFLIQVLFAQQDTQNEESVDVYKRKTKISSDFSIQPPLSFESLQKKWNIQGAVEVKDSKIYLHNGQPKQKSVMFNYYPLHYDDYMELSIKVKFEKKISQSQNQTAEDQMNAFVVQFLPSYPHSSPQLINQPDVISLEGLSILIMTHDSHPEHEQNVQTYFATYRYFQREISLKREYLNVFQQDVYESCDFQAVRKITDLRFVVDYEFENTLTFMYKNYEDQWVKCFTVPHIYKYITKMKSFLQIQQTNGSQYTLETELYELLLREKEHRLNVDKNKLVSHHLAEEIFDKVKNFTEIFETDKENLASIVELQNTMVKKAKLLEVYTRDLNKGSRKFQEFMIESLNKHRIVNPASFPLLIKVKEKIDALEQQQAKIYQKFVDIKSLVSAKQIFKRTVRNFQNVDKELNQVVKLIQDSKFKDYISKSKQIINMLNKVDVQTLTKQIKDQIDIQDEHAAKANLYGIIILGIIGFFIMLFVCGIIRTIKKEEKSHFA